jgi:hypothetical protein
VKQVVVHHGEIWQHLPNFKLWRYGPETRGRGGGLQPSGTQRKEYHPRQFLFEQAFYRFSPFGWTVYVRGSTAISTTREIYLKSSDGDPEWTSGRGWTVRLYYWCWTQKWRKKAASVKRIEERCNLGMCSVVTDNIVIFPNNESTKAQPTDRSTDEQAKIQIVFFLFQIGIRWINTNGGMWKIPKLTLHS